MATRQAHRPLAGLIARVAGRRVRVARATQRVSASALRPRTSVCDRKPFGASQGSHHHSRLWVNESFLLSLSRVWSASWLCGVPELDLAEIKKKDHAPAKR